MALSSLKLADIADTELLAIVDDLGDEANWTSIGAIAERLDIQHPDAVRCVSARLAWMRRWGWVERDAEYTGRWMVTETGHELLGGQVNDELRNLLRDARPADQVRIIRLLGQRTIAANWPAMQLYRREWRRTVELA